MNIHDFATGETVVLTRNFRFRYDYPDGFSEFCLNRGDAGIVMGHEDGRVIVQMQVGILRLPPDIIIKAAPPAEKEIIELCMGPIDGERKEIPACGVRYFSRSGMVGHYFRTGEACQDGTAKFSYSFHETPEGW